MSHVDLKQLAGDRDIDRQARPRRKRRWVGFWTRYVLPLFLFAGFAGVLGYSLRELFVERTPVSVVPVMAVRTEVEVPESPLFQGAGWIEPRPTPVLVTALEEGVVMTLHVIEGQAVQVGDVVAELIDVDAKLAVRTARAEVKSHDAEEALAAANLAAAQARLREPIERQTELAEAEALLARVDSERSRLPSQIRAARAREALARKEAQTRAAATGAVSKLAVARAESDVETAAAASAELEAQQEALVREHAARQSRVAGLRRQLELKTEEHRAVKDAEAAVDLAKARLERAAVALEQAELRASRMRILAPAEGTVLSLVARPGSKVMGLAPAAAADAATVITMYDPKRLQVRADVRLEDVSRVHPGQAVRIETPAVKGPLVGTVIATTSFTDIQKNTVQVKVSVESPPEVLKPDMLVQVTFLAPARKSESKPGSPSPTRLLVPQELVDTRDSQSTVWIADRADGVARRRAVTLGGLSPEGWREVRTGLSLGDRLIASSRESLKEGQLIRIVSEAAPREYSLPADQ